MAYKGRSKKGSRSRSRRTRRNVTSKRRSTTPKNTFARLISKVVSKYTENKRMTTEFTKNFYNITGGVASFQPNNIIPLCPNAATGGIYTISQGVGQQQRIGNSITIKKAYLRGMLVPSVYNAISNPTPSPVHVKMWIFSVKRNVLQMSQADVYQTLNSTFFANGNSSLGMLGNVYDLITPTNKDVVTLYFTKTFKLGFADYAGVTGGATTSDPKTSNDYKLNHKITLNITKYLPKKMLFNDADNGTVSRQVYCAWEPVYYNGASMTAATSPCGFFGGIDLHYEDA